MDWVSVGFGVFGLVGCLGALFAIRKARQLLDQAKALMVTVPETPDLFCVIDGSDAFQYVSQSEHVARCVARERRANGLSATLLRYEPTKVEEI